jgi:hypothetical protein
MPKSIYYPVGCAELLRLSNDQNFAWLGLRSIVDLCNIDPCAEEPKICQAGTEKRLIRCAVLDISICTEDIRNRRYWLRVYRYVGYAQEGTRLWLS